MKTKRHLSYLPGFTLTLVFLTAKLPLSAQTAAGRPVDPYFWEDTFGILTLLGGVLVVLFSLLTMLQLLRNLVKAEEKRALGDTGPEPVGLTEQAAPSWWSEFLQSATAAVPVAREKDIDLGHEYD